MKYRRARLATAVVLVLAASTAMLAQQARAPQAPAAQTLNLQDVIPLDTAIRTTTLPNGITVYVRRNEVPARRVSMRLAVKAGSINEADDQQGLAHLLEHMAFNGSAHFKAGELVSYFERVGSRLGPHVNAYTSFDETVYMLELPTDRPEVVTQGLTALADFGGALTLDPAEIDKERGVVIEEWRGGLGAGSRIRDKQFPILFFNSRYADRLPIGKPDILRTAPAARVRAFYDTWYRPDRLAVSVVGDVDAQQVEQSIRTAFSSLAVRAPAAPDPNKAVPLQHPLLVSVVSDPELTRSTVEISWKRAHEGGPRVGDYRQDLVDRFVINMIDDRFEELARRPDAQYLGAGASKDSLSRTVDAFSLGASVQDGKIAEGLAALMVEAKRLRQFGFGDAELDRAKRSMLAYFAQAYAERDKSQSRSFADEYIRNFLQSEPAPGITYEYQLVQQVLPSITAAEASARVRALVTDSGRVVLAVSPQKAGVTVPTEANLQAALAAGDAVAVMAWAETATTRALMDTKPAPAAVTARREIANLGVTVVRFANGVEAWLKPTDFKNDQVVFGMEAPGGLSLAPRPDWVEATLATSYVGLAGIGGIKPVDLQKLLAGKLAGASPFIGLSTHGINGSAAPADLEIALQLLHQDFTSPNDDAETFALLKRQLTAAVANRGQAPQQVFGERVTQVNTSGHYTSEPLTVERVATLDRAKMTAFYRQRFANAADFTFFMVGAFKVDEAMPLLAQYVGSLPSTGRTAARFEDLAIQFPSTIQRELVVKGREPRGQTIISFFADPSAAPLDQEHIIAANTVLNTSLRDILREELGQTYTVGVGLNQPLPQRGAGRIQVTFGAAPQNLTAMTDRVLREVKRLQDEGPSADLTNRAKETASRGYEESLKDNAYWLGRMRTVRLYSMDPGVIVTRTERINSITPQILQDTFKRYFPLDRYTVVTLVPEP
ncbi:MAG: insulinase family protein [Vicinamibacterales bacterium]